MGERIVHIYKSASSSSGRGIWAASCISFWYCSSTAWSTVTSGGARAGAATNSCLAVSFLPACLKESSYQGLVADEFPGEPEERLLEVVVGLGRDVVVLEVLLAVEGDGLGLHLALLNVDLVASEDDGDVLADTDQVTWRLLAECCMSLVSHKRTVPVGDVLVCDARCDVEHDDTTLAVDVVSITETTELLLACGVPDVELDGAEVLACLSVCCIACRRLG